MGISQSAPSTTDMDQPNPYPESGRGCPMHEVKSRSSSNTESRSKAEEFNNLNNIPPLSQEPSAGQLVSLPRERVRSSIPRSGHAHPSTQEVLSSCPMSAADSKQDTWVYPSPQQFYNALVRKGWETPVEAVPVMVDIHNWMNEAVWQEVLRWESRYFNSSGTKNVQHSSLDRPESSRAQSLPDISLARFQGRPQDLSPKARYHLLLGRLFPSVYNTQKPFDRHDWMIRRDSWGVTEQDKLHRYVIDYYAGAGDERGNPVFHFDVRPAIDDVDSLTARLKEWARIKQESWFSSTQTAANDSRFDN